MSEERRRPRWWQPLATYPAPRWCFLFALVLFLLAGLVAGGWIDPFDHWAALVPFGLAACALAWLMA